MNDRMEVSSLSRQAILYSLYLPDYRKAFAFSMFPYPLRQQCSLRFTCRYRQHNGLTLFRLNFRAGRTPPFRRRHIVHDGPWGTDHTLPLTILVQACQHFWLVKPNDV